MQAEARRRRHRHRDGAGQEGLRAQARQRADPADALRPAVEEGGLGRCARDADRRRCTPGCCRATSAPAATRCCRWPTRARRSPPATPARGNEAALQANRLAPTLIPAAALAARAQAGNGAKRKATKTLTAAWAAAPHPDLAAAFAAHRARRDPGGAAQAVRDADRRQPRRMPRAGCSTPSWRWPPRTSRPRARRWAISPRPIRPRAAWR